MRRITQLTILLFLTALATGLVLADDFLIYPTKGQSNEQMKKDKFECYTWAKGQTGFDPMKKPTATAPLPNKKLNRAV